MANWWEAAPLAEKATPQAGANWWEAAPVTQASAPVQTQPSVSMGEAIGAGAAQGATFNFADELEGLRGAGAIDPQQRETQTNSSGQTQESQRAPLDDVVRGVYNYWSGKEGADRGYDEALKIARDYNKRVEKERPNSYLGGQVLGGAMLPVGAAAQGATLPVRMGRGAMVGAGVGAASGLGAGDTPFERGTGAVTGLVAGGAIGAVAPPLVEGAARGIKYGYDKAANAVRGAINPEAEAGRRVLTAIGHDINADPQATNRLTPTEFNAEPSARIVDMGGDATRRLADSAAITSSQAETAIKKTISDRFEGQGPRVTDWLRSTFNYPDAAAQQQAIQQTAKTVNKANYAKAYSDGSKPIWDEGFQQLTASPDFREAVKAATRVGANDAAVSGFRPPVNPFHFAEDGTMTLKQGVHPTLQFWDHVKRALDSKIEVAKRGGDKELTGQLSQIKSAMVNHLDELVPSYKTARQGAASAFDADDALQAGQNFIKKEMKPAEARAAIAKMTPTERQLFQDGFVSEYIDNLSNVADKRSVLNKIAESPAAREKLHIAIGPHKTAELEAKLRVEDIMDRTRTAVTGNSWTAKRLYDLGLAGGTGISAHGAYDMDPKEIATGALIGALASGGKRINANLAKRVGEMLVSDDPKVLAQGIRVLTSNGKMMDALRSADNTIARVIGQQSPQIPAVQALGIGRAEEQQQGVPRPGQ